MGLRPGTSSPAAMSTLAMLLAVLGGLLTGPMGAPASALGAPSPATTSAQPAAPVDVAGINADRTADGVAIRGAQVDAESLVAIVADAREHDLQLSVVVLGDNLPGGLPATEALARELRSGAETVLLLTPDWLAADSGELSEQTLNRALDAAEAAGADDLAAAREFTDAALGRGGVPWGWLAVAGVTLVVVLVAGGRWWEQRRRRQADTAALTTITDRLRAELSRAADAVVTLEPQVALADEPARKRYAEASVAYRKVRQELERPVTSRAHGERIGARLAKIHTMLDEVRDALDRARRSWGPDSKGPLQSEQP